MSKNHGMMIAAAAAALFVTGAFAETSNTQTDSSQGVKAGIMKLAQNSCSGNSCAHKDNQQTTSDENKNSN